MEVVVNGQTQTVPERVSVLELLHALNVDPQRVAIELNRIIVRQPEWESTTVAPGSQVEIVQFVGGG